MIGIESRMHTHVTSPAMEYDHGLVLSILGKLYNPKVVSYRDYREAYLCAKHDGIRVHWFEPCELGLYSDRESYPVKYNRWKHG